MWTNLALSTKKLVFLAGPLFTKLYLQKRRLQDLHFKITKTHTAWKVSKYGVISGPCFPVFSPNTFSVIIRQSAIIELFTKANFSISCVGKILLKNNPKNTRTIIIHSFGTVSLRKCEKWNLDASEQISW